MFEWLNDLKPGDEVVTRDSSRLGCGGMEPAIFGVEVVKEITGEHIKTLPVGYEPKPAPTIEPFRLFDRRFGSSNSVELVRKSNA